MRSVQRSKKYARYLQSRKSQKESVASNRARVEVFGQAAGAGVVVQQNGAVVAGRHDRLDVKLLLLTVHLAAHLQHAAPGLQPDLP